MTFQESHWYLKDLQYEYLDDGFKLTATTDVPCHLYCRMTTTPPRKHALPSYRRGLALQGDIRFCFVVYEDNEQDEAGDTLIHTWYKASWPICETRWFYFVGTMSGAPVVSESPIFKFHFPAPPPEPPPPLTRLLVGAVQNATLTSTHGVWLTAWNGSGVFNSGIDGAPFFRIGAGPWETASWFINRGFLFFPPPNLPAAAIILSANLYIYPSILDFPPLDPTLLCLTEGKQGVSVRPDDWPKQNPVTTIAASRRLDTFTLFAYNSIPLNAYGLSLVKSLSPLNFCLRQKNDIDNDEPSPLSRHVLYFHSAQKGVGFRPYLEVNYFPA